MPAALSDLPEEDPEEDPAEGPTGVVVAATVRPACLADAHALYGLELRCFPGDRMNLRQYRFHLRSPRARLLVAEAGGNPVGGATILLRSSSRRARLYSIMVDPSARGLGLGRLLLDRAEQVAREAGAISLHLEVRQDNRPAIALYEHMGYRCIGHRPRYYHDGADAWRYRRDL